MRSTTATVIALVSSEQSNQSLKFFSFDPRNGKPIPFSDTNSQLLNARYADLMASSEDRLEVPITIILPHGGHITAHFYLKRNGYHFQTTSRVIIGGQGTVPGMRDCRHYTEDCEVELRQTNAREWRVADKPEYFNDLYRYERLTSVSKRVNITADWEDVANDGSGANAGIFQTGTIPFWKICMKNLEEVGGSLSELLYGLSADEWSPCTSKQSRIVEEGYENEGRPPKSTNLFDGAIACTIKYVNDNYATQTIVGLNGYPRIRVLRRDLIAEEEHKTLLAAEEDCEECVICYEPILSQHACTILACAHNNNVHAACMRHCETRQNTIECMICRTKVQVAPPPAQPHRSFGR